MQRSTHFNTTRRVGAVNVGTLFKVIKVLLWYREYYTSRQRLVTNGWSLTVALWTSFELTERNYFGNKHFRCNYIIIIIGRTWLMYLNKLFVVNKLERTYLIHQQSKSLINTTKDTKNKYIIYAFMRLILTPLVEINDLFWLKVIFTKSNLRFGHD